MTDDSANDFALAELDGPLALVAEVVAPGEHAHREAVQDVLLGVADGAVNLMLKLGLSDRKVLDHIYLSAFARYPKEQEVKDVTALLARARDNRNARREASSSVAWSAGATS